MQYHCFNEFDPKQYRFYIKLISKNWIRKYTKTNMRLESLINIHTFSRLQDLFEFKKKNYLVSKMIPYSS